MRYIVVVLGSVMVLSIPALYCERLKQKRIFSLTSYSFYISTLILKLAMTVIVVHNCYEVAIETISSHTQCP